MKITRRINKKKGTATISIHAEDDADAVTLKDLAPTRKLSQTIAFVAYARDIPALREQAERYRQALREIAKCGSLTIAREAAREVLKLAGVPEPAPNKSKGESVATK